MMNILTLFAALQVSVPGLPLRSYPDVYQHCIDNQKPFLVIVGADWCRACRVLKQKTVPQMAGEGKLDGIQVAYVDFDRSRELAQKLMSGRNLPQVLRYRHNGKEWEIARLPGVPSARSLANFARMRPVDSKQRVPILVGSKSQPPRKHRVNRWPWSTGELPGSPLGLNAVLAAVLTADYGKAMKCQKCAHPCNDLQWRTSPPAMGS